MTIFAITLFVLLTFPIISFFIVRGTKNKPQIRKRIIRTLVCLHFISIFGLITHISTTSLEIDWILLMSIYLTLCILLWLGVFFNNIVIRILSILFMVCTFGSGYIFGTIGILGLGLIVYEYEPKAVKWLEDGIIYKEKWYGNAISNYRATEVEIYKTIPMLPIIEWRIQNRVYEDDFITIKDETFTVDYNPKEQNIYLSFSKKSENNKYNNWVDTISIAGSK